MYCCRLLCEHIFTVYKLIKTLEWRIRNLFHITYYIINVVHSFSVFLKISELCGKSWREIARRLNIREGDIDSIESKHHLDLQEKCYEV